MALANGSRIYRQGESAKSVYCILQGRVHISSVASDGTTFIAATLGAGDLFSPALGGAAVADDTAKAKGPVSLWQAPLGEFRELLLRHPAVAWEVVAFLASRQRKTERRLESFALKRVEVRLAETFCELSGGFATRCEHGFGQHLRLTQQELADMVGASRPVVSTLLNKLRDQGVLGYNRDYICVRKIQDIERLVDS